MISDPQLVLAWFTGMATLVTALTGAFNSFRNSRKIDDLHQCLDNHHEAMRSAVAVAVETATDAKMAAEVAPAVTAELVVASIKKD